MVHVKLKGISSSSLCGLRTPLLRTPSYLSLAILYSFDCRLVTLWVNVSLSKRVVLSCYAVLAAAVKLLEGFVVYL